MANFAVFDVILLIALFFHRYVLRTLGLWKDAQRETGDDLIEVGGD